jgi:predicted nucleotidyltransferase
VNEPLVDRVTRTVAAVPGVVAVALGGSRARGTASPDSDTDLGLYYRPPLDLVRLREVATSLDDRGEVDVTEPGAWGEWVDGGAWLVVDGERVDLLYRQLGRVERYLADALAGRLAFGYQVGHPHGVGGHSYLGELACARVLHDPGGALEALRSQLAPYPEPLRATVIRRFGGEARFTLELAAKAAHRADVAYVSASLSRASWCLLQALFATNRRWLLNEKGAVAEARSLPAAPPELVDVLEAVLGGVGRTPAELARSVDAVHRLLDAVDALCEAPDP